MSFPRTPTPPNHLAPGSGARRRGGILHPLGRVCDECRRCSGRGVRSLSAPPRRCARSVGDRSAFGIAVRPALSGGFEGRFPCKGRCQPGSRRSLGPGGGAVLQRTFGGRRRNLGRSIRADLHGDPSPGHAGGGRERSLLVDPESGGSRPQRRTRTLARRLAAGCGRSLRPEGAGRSALAGGAVPLAPSPAGRMGGDL